MTTPPTKTVALFASKLGYQTGSFEAAARKLAVELAYVTTAAMNSPILGATMPSLCALTTRIRPPRRLGWLGRSTASSPWPTALR
jgi:hypothetical protein